MGFLLLHHLMRKAPQDVKLLDLDDVGPLRLSYQDQQHEKSSPDERKSFLKNY